MKTSLISTAAIAFLLLSGLAEASIILGKICGKSCENDAQKEVVDDLFYSCLVTYLSKSDCWVDRESLCERNIFDKSPQELQELCGPSEFTEFLVKLDLRMEEEGRVSTVSSETEPDNSIDFSCFMLHFGEGGRTCYMLITHHSGLKNNGFEATYGHLGSDFLANPHFNKLIKE